MIFPRKPEGIIFDMDGLLVDTIPLYITAMIEAGIVVGYPVSREYVLSLVGLLGKQLHRRLRDDLGANFPVDRFLERVQDSVGQALIQGAPLKKGALELIRYLAAAQIPLAVATSMKRAEAEYQLEKANIRHQFARVVGRDEVALSKPHPDVYLKAAAHLKLQPCACIALEDSFNGVRSAQAAGCMTIMVPDVLTPTAEVASLCVGIVCDLQEVMLTLQEHHGHLTSSTSRTEGYSLK